MKNGNAWDEMRYGLKEAMDEAATTVLGKRRKQENKSHGLMNIAMRRWTKKRAHLKM